MTSDSTSTPRLRVAICGGGIGGLMLAIALAPYKDIEINIYEGASKFETIGAGLAIWGAAVQAFKKLGIEERLSTIAPGNEDESGFELRRSNRPEGEQYGTLVFSRTMGFHRATFLDVLVELFNTRNTTGKIHFGKRCVKYEYAQNTDTKDVEIHFKDGTTATCDVLVGSDGIRSVIRKQLVDETAKDKGWSAQDSAVDSTGLRFSGTVAYRALVNPASIPDHPARKDRKMHIVTYPVAGGKFINPIAYVSNPERHDEWMNGPWTTDVDRNDVLEEYSDFESEVQVMLNTVETFSRWALFEVDPLPAWANGPVTVLGDSAHAMNPFIGSAGGQVIEDAYILAHLLGLPDVTPDNVPSLLRSYEFIRKPRSEKILQCTREAKRVLEFMGEYATASNEYIKKTFDERVLWLWEGKLDLDQEVERGRKEFERLRNEACV
ncbi:hypothetical protein Clacol_008005 [Clathrus columnatus]|uniref:FAD-binding domain-containing protein n=1 Tax=Clathrus columnatus TaxID=1419009 RepID=A0AAV5AM08_9AGAM|nr:hypothetical protein Clacol_008005 [Clathrus columnatus]